MELRHEFTVERPLDEVWPVLVDLESVAEALPGASVDDAESDGTRHGRLRVKLGSFIAAFRGKARYTAIDDAGHQFTLEGSGNSPQGNATLRITGVAVSAGTGTTVTLNSSIDLTGRIAQFGSSMAPDVVSQMLDVFVVNLTRRFSSSESDPTGAPLDRTSGPAETLDLGASLLPGLAQRLQPVAVAVVALAIGLLIGRRGRSTGTAIAVVPLHDLHTLLQRSQN